MTEITLQKMTELVYGRLIGNPEQVVSEILTDSRSIVSSDLSIFFAIKGDRHDGHNYIPDLYVRGIKNFVITDYIHKYSEFEDANFVIVDDSMRALHKLALFHRTSFQSEVLAIIGSNGKTIVKEWLYQLLHKDLKIVRSPKSYNSQLGVALSLCLLDNTYNLGIIEAGISKPGEMKSLEKITKPDCVIFTSLGQAHQENFDNLEEKAYEKLKMLYSAGTLIYSPDYPEIEGLVNTEDSFSQKKVFTWSLQNKDADLYISEVKQTTNSSEITAVYNNEKTVFFKIPFIDEASVKNACSCLSYIICKDYLNDKVLSGFEFLEPVEMRVEQKQGINNCIIINDAYNSDINSVKIAADLLRNTAKHLPKTIILSDIAQSGLNELDLYTQVSNIILKNNITRLIGIGKQISSCKRVFKANEFNEFYNSTEEFLLQDLKKRFKNEVILLKGARNFEFEKISEVLELKKHRTVLEINLEAITHNFNYFKSLLPPGTKTMVMVKALSYGSGTYEIAELLQYHHVDYLGVAIADEGVRLRKAGITTKIIVMNPEENSISDIINYQLEPEIYNFKILHAFINNTETYSGTGLPIHIKFDTGMNRLGFIADETNDLIKLLKQTKSVFVKSVFSHLAASDENEHDAFTKHQIELFQSLCNQLSESLNYKFIKHIANTSGIERFPEAVFDMVRIGIGLYGFNGINQNALMNVSTLKTKIIQIKSIKKGESVGYGRAWIAPKDSKIAIIPIGYADGFRRELSNGKGKVLIKGTLVPVVGRICMDMSMIDISSINADEDDELIIFGDAYPASELAKQLHTISYEIISGISERVKRIYIG